MSNCKISPEYEQLNYRRLGEANIYAIAKLKNKSDGHILWRIRSIYGGEINLTNEWLEELIEFTKE